MTLNASSRELGEFGIWVLILYKREETTHILVLLVINISLKASVKEASDKIEGIFVNLMNSGIVSDIGPHPLPCQKIYYKSVVLPSALYGC